MTFNMQHLIDFLRDFPDVSIERRFDLAKQRWSVADIRKAMRIMGKDSDDAERWLRTSATAQEMIGIVNDWPTSMTFVEIVATKAGLGDPLAVQWAAIFGGPIKVKASL